MDLFGRKRKRREAVAKARAEFEATQYSRQPAMEGDWAKKFISKSAQKKTRTYIGGEPIIGSGIHRAVHHHEKRPWIERVYDKNGYVGLAFDQRRFNDVRESVKLFIEDPTLVYKVVRNRMQDRYLEHRYEHDAALFV